MKIVINTCFGGFAVTRAVYKDLDIKWDEYGDPVNEDFGIEDENIYAYRADPRLIAAIEKRGVEKAGENARLKIVDIPKNTSWHIHEYDGAEHVAEGHKTWS